MSDQLHKLEVEELELKQKIRRKELNETTAELFPPPAPLPDVATDRSIIPSHGKKKRSSKGTTNNRKLMFLYMQCTMFLAI